MFTSDQYELLDIGEGRRLERFGQYVLDRPAPAADRTSCQRVALWKNADARFEKLSGVRGVWSQRRPIAKRWQVRHEAIEFELRRTDSGAIGVYPEQAANWDWISEQSRSAKRPLRILNLFAHTGGSTLAAAAAGAEVVHVDAARSVVAWARQNAELSGLSEAPIRWIVEDARKFAEREVRRGAQYDGVILDPPSYGHGPKAQPWKLTDHLDGLLRTVRELTRKSPAFVLLTCHAPGMGPPEVEAMLAEYVFGHCQSGVSANRLWLKCSDGRRLNSGVAARWPRR